MITDEQIKALAVKRGFKLNNVNGDDLKPYVHSFSRDLIALAQQVKPLEFVRDHGSLWCKTSIGEYSIHLKCCDEGDGYVFELDESDQDDEVYRTEDEAINATQKDYWRRALSCLVHGGGSDGARS